MQKLRIFLSSPGDVAAERAIARKVIGELQGSHLLRDKVQLDLVTWDDPDAATPLEVGVTPQESVNRYAGKPSDSDLTVVVLWSRIGSVPEGLKRADGTSYPSGTVWELEDAQAAGKPVWLYRRASKPQIDIDDPEFEEKRAQYSAVDRLVEGYRGDGGGLNSGVNNYPDSAAFERVLRQHLEAFINERLSAATPEQSEDVERLIGKLMLENQALSSERQSLLSRIDELEAQIRAAVTRTFTAAAAPGASVEAVWAAEALQRGDVGPAQAALLRQERTFSATAALPGTVGGAERAARRDAAQLAREQGALLFGRDSRASLAAFQRAAEHDPDDTWTYFFIGDLQRVLGNTAAARASYETGHQCAERRFRANADDPDALRNLSVSYEKMGDILLAEGDRSAALAAYNEDLAIAQRLAARDPENATWKRDLSVSQNKVGDVLLAQGDSAGAMALYAAGLAIRETLIQRDAGNNEWQRDLSVSHNKIGDVLLMQGRRNAAMDAYRSSLAIRERLAAADPGNAASKRDLAFSHDRIGDALRAHGDAKSALAAYRKSLELTEQLAADDRQDTVLQRDLSVSYSNIGSVLLEQNDTDGALQAFRQDLAIAVQLAASDPDNTGGQRDLAVSNTRIGDVLMRQRDYTGALAAYKESHAVFERLANLDPTNADWQRDLSIGNNKIGDVLRVQGDGDGALTFYGTGRQIREKLAALNPTNTDLRRDLSTSHRKIGDASRLKGDISGALTAFNKSLEISEQLVAEDPGNVQWQTDAALTLNRLGSIETLPAAERRTLLQRGRSILQQLRDTGRLPPAQDWLASFDIELRALDSSDGKAV